MDYALIKNGMVERIIVADAEFIASISKSWDHVESVDSIHAQGAGVAVGWSWDLKSGFSPPVVPIQDPQHEPRTISVGSFFDRFGSAKWAILADTTPTVQAVVKDASVRRHIDLDNPDLPMGLAIVQSAGHSIDPQAIVSAPIQPQERP